jgi:hypothetical protein
MATIDPNIALGVKPLQIENPMNQYAMMSQLQTGQNQNALAQYQLSAAQRADQAQTVQNKLYAKHFNPQTGEVDQPALLAELSQDPNAAGLIPKLQAQFTEEKYKKNQANKIVSEVNKLNFDLANNIFAQSKEELKQIDPRNPNAAAQYLAYRDRLYANPALADFFKNTGMTKEATDAQVREAIKTPQGLADVILKSMTTADQFQKILNDRQQTRIQQQNANTNAGQLSLAREKFAFDTNPEKQAQITKVKELAKAEVEETVSKVKDVKAAREVLKTAGFDPKTGTDDVKKLIRESTGSYLGAAVDAGGRVFGSSTKGADAIGQLKTFETKIALDLIGGKLGAGISNADRDFIIAGLGQISDNTVPRDTREKAWDRVVERMKRVGLIEDGSSSTSSGTNGVDTNNPLLTPPKKK